ncbi:sulfate ABC transporter permease [Halobacteriales archaeon QS_8_69_26]|nr:MAG: sulfate ABC transporter permease [Halobacteriales archaeon QS_8_69_26]
MASAGVIAAATGGGLRGALAAVAGTLLLGALWWVAGHPLFAAALRPLADLLAGIPLVGSLVPTDPGPRGPWVFLLGPVALSGVVALADEAWTGVAAATLGSVLVVALGLPVALFLARQDPDLVLSAARDPEVSAMLFLSVYAPLLAAGVAVVFGVPLAHLLARGFPGQAVVESLVDLPLVVPHSVAGLLVLFGFGEGGAFPGLTVLGGLAGMVLALTFVSAPFAVNAAREAIESVPREYDRAARVHGAGPLGTFLRVTLPLSYRGILTGGVLAWARAVSEFGAVAIVAYSVTYLSPATGREVTTQHAPVFIYNTYVTAGLAESGAVATLLLALSGAIFLAIRWLAYDGTGGVL